MKAREAGGNLARATSVEVFVVYDDSDAGGMWLPISKADARVILDDAKEKGIDVQATMDGNTLRIGEEHFLESDGAGEPGPVCRECGEDWQEGHECEPEDD